MPDSPTSDDSTPATPAATLVNVCPHAVMPRPGQLGSMLFDGNNITDFLEDWNIECEDYGLTDGQKCARFPNYCTPAIKDLVKLLPGYSTHDWTTLQANLKETYWQHDKPKDTHEALIRLVKEAPTMDLNLYLIKFTVITDSLIAKHVLSDLDRVGRLLDGLHLDLRSRVLKFCTKKSWRLSSHDTGTEEPNFEELKRFVLMEAKSAQKQTVYNNECAIREGNEPTTTSTVITSISPTMTNVPVTPKSALSPQPPAHEPV